MSIAFSTLLIKSALFLRNKPRMIKIIQLFQNVFISNFMDFKKHQFKQDIKSPFKMSNITVIIVVLIVI